MSLDPREVRGALQRAERAGAAAAPGGGADRSSPARHPNAPGGGPDERGHRSQAGDGRDPRFQAGPAHPGARGVSDGDSAAPRPLLTEEVEVLALLADHPHLIATADSLGVFSLLTDARLRDMYSASREGQPINELAPVHLPPVHAELVLSAKYVSETDPHGRLAALTSGLRRRVEHDRLKQLHARMTEARRHGDRDLERRLAAEIVSTRKQVD